MELKAILLPTALRYFSSDRLLFQAQCSWLDGGKLVTSMVCGDPKYRGYQRDASLGGAVDQFSSRNTGFMDQQDLKTK